MKMLYERLTQIDYSGEAEHYKKIFSELQKAEVIHIQNVADYYYEISDEDRYDFPNVAPPFDVFWMEFRVPEKFRAEGRSGNNPHRGKKFGYLLSAVSFKPNIFAWDFPDAQWLYSIALFVEENDGQIYQNVCCGLGVHKDGSITKAVTGGRAMGIRFSSGKTPTQDEARACASLFDPVLLAISFMHCKNVTLIPREPKVGNKRPSRRASKIRYHTLQIEPMKKILREEGKSEETGLKHALHICRGHFKDYRDGKGLFGRYKDMYWWDSQVRGRAEHGVVLKDYNVNEPSESE